MKLHPNREEARRRRLVNRSAAQNRQIFFDAIHGNTVNVGTMPTRRSSRQAMATPDIDDPRVTLALKAGVLSTMLGTVLLFRAPLLTALQSLFV